MSEVEAGTDVPPEGEASASPHGTSVVVWDAPSTVECGKTFGVKLGVKCSAECRPDGWTIEILDHDGTVRATAAPSDEPWPGTAALYFAEVELSAPDTDGLYSWEAKALGAGLSDDLDIPHAECITPFGVRVVPTPECVLTVVAIDMESQTPVEGAKVVLHPYKTFTDERGMAEVSVPRGEYRLFVSGKKHFPFKSDCDVQTDLTIRAELALDLELTDADIWS